MWASCVIRNLYRTHRSLLPTSTTIYLASIIGLYSSFLTPHYWLFVSMHRVKVNETKFEVLVARNESEPARKRNDWTRLTFLSSLVIISFRRTSAWFLRSHMKEWSALFDLLDPAYIFFLCNKISKTSVRFFFGFTANFLLPSMFEHHGLLLFFQQIHFTVLLTKIYI